jgi:tRNA(Ile)-lysidine synthase
VLVALSGGADSLALAAAAAVEGDRAGVRVGAVIVDHALQPGSAAVAQRAAEQARTLGLEPVVVRVVAVAEGPAARTGGAEAAARSARYGALEAVRRETAAGAILLGHTLDDQAETVLLGLARGSGAASLSGMSAVSGFLRRPLLGIRRVDTEAVCRDLNLTAWDDPWNSDPSYARVRVRQTVLPVLEAQLGPGIAVALARTAATLREDAEALDAQVLEFVEEICEPAEAGIAISVAALAANPAALRQRVIRFVVESEFGISLTREHTLAAARLVTDWHGQKPVDLPGIRVGREGALLVFRSSSDDSLPDETLDRTDGTE